MTERSVAVRRASSPKRHEFRRELEQFVRQLALTQANGVREVISVIFFQLNRAANHIDSSQDPSSKMFPKVNGIARAPEGVGNSSLGHDSEENSFGERRPCPDRLCP